MATSEEATITDRSQVGVPGNAGFALSLEGGLYLLLWGLGAALRLVDLGLPLLGAEEARRALSAYQAIRGETFDLSSGPTLLYSMAAFFFVLSPSDLTARLGPALAGIALLVLPCLLRGRLGREAALFGTALLAFSPTLVFTARQASAEAPVLLLLAASGYFWVTRRDEGSRWRLRSLGVTLGLLLACGPAAYALLTTLALVGLLGSFVLPRPPLSLDELLRQARQWLPALGLTLLLVATGGLSRPDGLQRGVIDAAALGVASLLPAGEGWALFSALGTLVAYEPLLFVAGLFALAYWRRLGLDARWGLLWAGLGLLLAGLAGGQRAPWFSFALLPAAVVGGVALGVVWHRLRDRFSVGDAALFLATGLPLVWLFGIVAGYLSLPDARVPALTIVVPPVLLWVSAALWGWWRGTAFAVNGLAVLAAVVLAGLALHTATAVAARDPLAPGNLAAHERPAADLRHLLQEIDYHAAVYSRPGLKDVNLAVQGTSRYPLAWYLRRYARVTYDAPVARPALAVVASEGLAPGDAYLRQRYALSEQNTFAAAGLSQLWRWLVYREHVPSRAAEEVWLYVLPQVGN
ncbi:MAG: glycosyltransferase family 39 protein [Chloroflexota bacterium]